MKAKIHPKYNVKAQITCACGNVMEVGSTVDALKTDICSHCHPFYTGKNKLIDTAGRVDKFKARMEAAKKHQENSMEKAEPKEKNKGEKYLTLEEIEKLKGKTEKKSEKAVKAVKTVKAAKPVKKAAKSTKKAAPKKKTVKKAAK